MPAKSEDIGAFIVITTAFILVLILFIIAILFLYKRKQFMLLHRMELLKSEYEKSLLSSQLEIKEQTLSDFSYEIHDNIILLLSVAKLNLNTINWSKLPETQLKISDAFEQVQKAIDDLTLLSQTLNSNYITNLGLSQAIELEIKKIERLKLFKISFEIYETEVSMDPKKEIIVFRIVQEAIRNSLRHAKANHMYRLLRAIGVHGNAARTAANRAGSPLPPPPKH